MDIKFMRLIFNDIELNKRDISKVRGFIAGQYANYDKLHNHDGKRFIYRYPLIQYKVVHNKPSIIGINDGVQTLQEINKTLSYLDIANNRLEIFEKVIGVKSCQYGNIDHFIHYQFITPWMCLNSKNYLVYLNSTDEEKELLLERILIGNIISMSKGLNYSVSDEIKVKLNLQSSNVKFKNQNMLCFTGKFITNFRIPDYLGVGKSVSRGFGTIVQL